MCNAYIRAASSAIVPRQCYRPFLLVRHARSLGIVASQHSAADDIKRLLSVHRHLWAIRATMLMLRDTPPIR
eukprot:2851178-Pyramimonas_sp.AAC.1